MKRRETIPTYIYGVRIDGLASNRWLIEMACCCAILLWLVVCTGNWWAGPGLIYTAAMLVRWCREKRRAADLCALRKFQSDRARTHMARAAGRGAAYRLTVGLQKPLELSR